MRIHPERIVNKTNGISFRRWLYQANPGLMRLIVEAIGPEVEDDRLALQALAAFADDASFREQFAAVRRVNKVALARVVAERLGFGLDPDALFDVHIKRIHEYKRQLLNVLETIALYNAMRAQPQRAWVPRVKIFAGKAAAGYQQAKLIIKLACDVARVVNRDPVVRGRLKVVFVPNYNVSLAEAIIPAADLSEQISTAGMEASGTGNMKLALNGALTIGTLDGANIEIKEHVGGENMFIFGLVADEVAARRRNGLDATATIAASAGARRGARCDRSGDVLAGRQEPLSRPRRRAAPSRLLHGHRGLRGLPRRATRGQRALAGQGRMVAHRRAQYGANELVLRRSRDSRLRPGHLARGTGLLNDAFARPGRSRAGGRAADRGRGNHRSDRRGPP